MENKGLYISKIEVNDLLHLKDFTIEVPQDNAPCHLFITGPNGTGKTILLKEIGKLLEEVADEQNSKLNSIESMLVDTQNEIVRLEADIKAKQNDIQQYKKDYNAELEKKEKSKNQIEHEIAQKEKEYELLKSKLANAENEIKKCDDEKQKIQRSFQSIDKESNSEISGLNIKITYSENLLSQLRESLLMKQQEKSTRFFFTSGIDSEISQVQQKIIWEERHLSSLRDEYNMLMMESNNRKEVYLSNKNAIKRKEELAVKNQKLIANQIQSKEEELALLRTKKSKSGDNVMINSILSLIDTNENIVEVISRTLDDKKQIIQFLEKERDLLKNKIDPISIYGVHSKDIINKYKKKQYLLSYYDDYRTNHFKEVERDLGKPNLDVCDIHTSKVDQFLKYLVDLKVQQSVALNKNEKQKVDEINKWFDNFTDILRELFDDKKLKLLYNDKSYEFKISSNKKKFGFTELSAGYNSALDIIVDLMLKMSSSGSEMRSYEMPGIVLIDEVETHLHLALQRHIMPMLTKFFPKIQFIVTTHSPFVLNSIENAVAYDLVTREAINDLNEYSYSALAEAYFGVSTESSYLINLIDRFKRLTNKAKLSASEKDEIEDLREQLEKVPEWASPNIKTRFYELDSNYRTKVM